MCGIAGIFSHKPVASELYDSIIHLQHRGQDAAGIMTYDERMHKEKGVGLAKEIFNSKNMELLTGNIGISHNRYPTHGGFSHGEVQPFWTSVPYGIALAHNGNLTNYNDLASEVTKTETRYLNTTSDSEVLLHLFADALHKDVPPQTSDDFFDLLCDSVNNIFNKVKGAYSVTSIIIGKGLVVFRDPNGIRPLVKGERSNGNGGRDYIFASENTMFYALGYEPKGTVLPGELIYVDESGKVLKGACEGRLCMTQSWPGQMRTVYGAHKRFIDTYFSQFDGKYFTGDGCRRDKDGYYWITGRVDDVIIVSGHNLGTAEIESAFVAHPKVAEAAVVGYPHDIKGNGLYCYVTLIVGEEPNGELERDLKHWVRRQIGPIATPDFIQFAPGLPKTRSGKIMRRILRKIAANEHDQLGDTTTLADPSVVESLVNNRKNA